MLGLAKRVPALRRSKLLRRTAYVFLLALFWVVIIVPTYLVYKQEISDTNVLPSSQVPPFAQFVNITARLGNIDPITSQYRISMNLDAVVGNGGQENNLFNVVNGERRLVQGITLFIQDVKKTFAADERLGAADATIKFDQGSTRGYPFDIHSTGLDVSARLAGNESVPVPLQMTLNGAVPGFSLAKSDVVVDQDRSFGDIVINLDIGRSGTTKGFSVFIIILSWALSLIMGFLALQVARLKRPVEPPLIASPAALLFALPSLRNVQPGVPSIGVTADIVGFFWNMTIVAVSAIVIILYFILRWTPPKPDPQSEPTPGDPLLPPSQQQQGQLMTPNVDGNLHQRQQPQRPLRPFS